MIWLNVAIVAFAKNRMRWVASVKYGVSPGFEFKKLNLTRIVKGDLHQGTIASTSVFYVSAGIQPERTEIP